VEVVARLRTALNRATAERAGLEWQSSQHFFDMENYAIINIDGGWLENIVLWDGNLKTWQPPNGTKAVIASEVDFSTLPERPDQ
jgi:hypothetical protein